MTKVVQFQQREQKILDVVMELLKSKTVLELKMSNVAKASGCSMGVIYSHFPSKEDLLLACVHSSMKKELEHVTQRLQEETDPLNQILIASIMFWLNGEKKPNDYTLKQFAINPHVWNAASMPRIQSVTNLIEDFSLQLSQISQQLILQYQLGEGKQDDSEQFNLGLFGLTIGIYQQAISEFGGIIGVESISEHSLESHYKHLMIRYLTSWGIDKQTVLERFEQLYQEAQFFLNNVEKNKQTC